MSDKYDNWERLVTSVLRRQRDREIALIDSCSVSPTSSVSDPNSPSRHLEYNYFQSNHHEYAYLMVYHGQRKEMLAPDKPEFIRTSAAPLMFFLDQRSGKNCFLLGAAWMCDWPTVEIKESRFSEAVFCTYPSILDIRAWIKAQILSPDTHYAAYLVFKSVGPVVNKYVGQRMHSSRRTRKIIMQLVPTINVSKGLCRSEISKFSTDRGDGWMEIKVGEFYIHQHHEKQKDIELVLCGMDIMDILEEEEILVEGLEFRPREELTQFFKSQW